MVLAVVGSVPFPYEVSAEAQQPVRQHAKAPTFPLGNYHAQEHELSPLPDTPGGITDSSGYKDNNVFAILFSGVISQGTMTTKFLPDSFLVEVPRVQRQQDFC